MQSEIMHNISLTWMMHLTDNQGIYLAMGVATSKPGSRDRAIENAMRLLDAGEVREAINAKKSQNCGLCPYLP